MPDRPDPVQARVERLLRERVRPAIERERAGLAVEAWHVPGEPMPFASAAIAEYEAFPVGGAWGPPWSTTWFRLRGAVPSAWSDSTGRVRTELVVDLGFSSGFPGFQAEGLIFRPDGTAIEGVAARRHSVPGAVGPDGRVDVLLEAAANPDVIGDLEFVPTPLGDLATAGAEPLYRLRRADVALVDLEVRDLALDLAVLAELAAELPESSTRRARLRAALEDALVAVDPDDVAGTAAAARAVLAPSLAAPAVASAQRTTAIGHAHIDSAWLWPVRETRRKVARTVSNVLALMDEDPDVVFAMSSAQQLAWLRDGSPALFERVRERIREGRFVPVGGMWVESDTNLPGGEALARQFVAGTRFFREALGVDSEVVWLPDSFGYTAALPQLARLAGKRYLLTQKASWNDTNRMPHHTFRWEGIDGSRILAHFPPADTYNSEVAVSDLVYGEANFADRDRASRTMLLYGYGDGGGGPTREMAARIRRTASLEGAPRTEHGTPEAFYRAAEAESPAAAVWSGELYLELHRGTYTSQRATKAGNRRNEHLLREAELWAATAAIRAGAPYPAADLERLWHRVLLLQFHDILPGSAIAWVHREAVADHAAITAELEALIGTCLATLVGDGDRELLAEAAPHARLGVPALGVGAPEPARTVLTEDADGFVLEDGEVRARIDRDGLLASLVHLASGRETLPPGTRGNLFQLHRDTPARWDAWDVDPGYRAVVEDLTAAEEVGPTSDGAGVRVVRAFGRSRLEQELRLVPGGELRITTSVDWQERERFLKLAFPVDVHADRVASEVQFGHVERPTHANTSWDVARFETSQHRWLLAAEPGFGVALVNDSVYGSDSTRIEREGGGTATMMRLSILRGARYPDPEQDRGRHRFAVGVVPGAGVLEAVAAGYRINLPERRVRGGAPVRPLLAVDEPGVVVEAVKLAEDGSGDLVVRLYEALGGRREAVVHLDVAHDGVVETDLHEQPLEGTAVREVAGAAVHLHLRAFQIVTLRVARPR